MDSQPYPQPEIQRVLSAVADDDCRAILAATAETPQTVQELVEECEIPTATAYRKVDELVDAGLLTDRVRVQTRGRNAREYILRVDDIWIGFEQGRLVADYSYASQTDADSTDGLSTTEAIPVPTDD